MPRETKKMLQDIVTILRNDLGSANDTVKERDEKLLVLYREKTYLKRQIVNLEAKLSKANSNLEKSDRLIGEFARVTQVRVVREEISENKPELVEDGVKMDEMTWTMTTKKSGINKIS